VSRLNAIRRLSGDHVKVPRLLSGSGGEITTRVPVSVEMTSIVLPSRNAILAPFGDHTRFHTCPRTRARALDCPVAGLMSDSVEVPLFGTDISASVAPRGAQDQVELAEAMCRGGAS